MSIVFIKEKQQTKIAQSKNAVQKCVVSFLMCGHHTINISGVTQTAL